MLLVESKAACTEPSLQGGEERKALTSMCVCTCHTTRATRELVGVVCTQYSKRFGKVLTAFLEHALCSVVHIAFSCAISFSAS
eukprot:m.33962 g.33962  ORF g.33962 m.33962 type:complete len:83 (+) comp9704_c0_seq1:265-513(+)